MIITTAGLKGGVSKTTIAINLAVCLQKAGQNVALVEATGEQEHLQQWRDRAPDTYAPPPVFPLKGAKIGRELRALEEAHDVVVADTPGWGGTTTRAVLLAADIAILPLTPGAADLADLMATIDLIGEANEAREGAGGTPLATIAVMSMVKGSSQLAADLARIVRGAEGVVLADTVIHHRAAVGKATLDGVGVIHGRDSKASREFNSLAEEVLALALEVAA